MDRESNAAQPAKSRRWLKRLFAIAIPLVLVVIAVGYWAYQQWVKPYELPTLPSTLTLADVGLEVLNERASLNRISPDPLRDPALPPEARPDPALAQIQYEAGLVLMGDADRDAQLKGVAYLQAAVKSVPENLFYGNTLRRAMLRLEMYREALQWWESLTSTAWQARLNQALAYVDVMADPSIGEARVGQLSLTSIGILDKVIEAQPHNWIARYARGLNNLYWPTGMRRYEKALADLSYAVALAQAAGAHHHIVAMSWVAYGDALVKSGQTSRGLQVWRDAHPGYRAYEPLARRAAAQDSTGAIEIVRQERGMEGFHRPNPDVPDLGPLWEEP
jgi:hypothetical protein